MKLCSLVLPLAILGTACVASDDEDILQALRNLEGRWEVTDTLVSNGQKSHGTIEWHETEIGQKFKAHILLSSFVGTRDAVYNVERTLLGSWQIEECQKGKCVSREMSVKDGRLEIVLKFPTTFLRELYYVEGQQLEQATVLCTSDKNCVAFSDAKGTKSMSGGLRAARVPNAGGL